MRILFSFAGGTGHLDPMVPIARATQLAGHTVAVTGRPAHLDYVTGLGFAAIPSGTDRGEGVRLTELVRPDRGREEQEFARGFAARMTRERAHALLEVCREWRPDLVVCDDADFGAMVAAEVLGLPYASVIVIVSGSFIRPELVAEGLREVRAEFGLEQDQKLQMLSRYLVLSPIPDSFRDPAYPLPGTAYSFRGFERAEKQAHERPTVYFTLGTVYNMESGDLFQRVLSGLTDPDLRVIVTVGRRIDPALFGPQPETVHLARFIPQEQVLPQADLVISHGGSGAVTGAMAYGLPSLLLPMGADQPNNADRVTALGMGLSLDVMTVTGEQVRARVRELLHEPSYREAAERMRAEFEALPGPMEAAKQLIRLGER